MLVKVRGVTGRFCRAGCAESLRCDRRAGLIYPAVVCQDQKVRNREEASVVVGFCAYCSADVRMTRAGKAFEAALARHF